MSIGPAVVALTGVSGYLGQRLLPRLEQDQRVRTIIGIDVKEPAVRSAKLDFHRLDITDGRLVGLFKERAVTHAVHLAFVLEAVRDREWARRVDVEGSRNLLEASLSVGARRIVVASSSVVYGAWPDNPAALTETSPLHPDKGLAYGADKVEVEHLCESYQAAHPELRISTVRVVTIVGPGISNFISRALEKPVQFLPWGFDPEWQLIHEEDCAQAFHELLWIPDSGPFNLAAEGTVRFSEIVKGLKKRIVRVPRVAIMALSQAGWKLGWSSISEAPGVLVNYFCYPPILDTTKLKNVLKVPFRCTSEQAIADFLSHRQVPDPSQVR